MLVCEGAASDMMENLNWGYIQLGLVALAFGGLQVWWISSTIQWGDLGGLDYLLLLVISPQNPVITWIE